LLKSKLKGILTMMIIKTKALEIGKIHFETHLNIFVSNVFLTLKIMNFENEFLKKLFILCYLKHGCIIYIYRSRYSKKLLYSKHNYKLGMKNVENRKIDQHRNAMCQMQSLERTLTLYFIVPFNEVIPYCSNL
jgi:hypothetical protein